MRRLNTFDGRYVTTECSGQLNYSLDTVAAAGETPSINMTVGKDNAVTSF
jgi:hypothetical protein